MIALPQDCEPELVIEQSDDEGDKLVLRFTSVVSSPGAFERQPVTERTVKVPKIYPIGTELCPECGEPLRPAANNWRICEKCNWEGDWSKVKHASGSVPEGTHKCNY